MSKTLVGVYWGARSSRFPICAQQAAAHFAALQDVDPGLVRWFVKAKRKPKMPTEVDVRSADQVAVLLGKGVNRRDTDKSVIAELGWSLSLWNGDLKGTSASTSVYCGCTSAHVGNNAMLEIHREAANGLSDNAAIELLKALIDVWDADSGIVSHSTWDDQLQRLSVNEVASYERRRWPVLLPKNAVRYANGLIRSTS